MKGRLVTGRRREGEEEGVVEREEGERDGGGGRWGRGGKV